MATKRQRKPIQAKPYASLSEEEILAMAKQIENRNKPPLEKMPINSAEQARAFLVECGYENLPPAKPNF